MTKEQEKICRNRKTLSMEKKNQQKKQKIKKPSEKKVEKLERIFFF